jgi:hypothetical protein
MNMTGSMTENPFFVGMGNPCSAGVENAVEYAVDVTAVTVGKPVQSFVWFI